MFWAEFEGDWSTIGCASVYMFFGNLNHQVDLLMRGDGLGGIFEGVLLFCAVYFGLIECSVNISGFKCDGTKKATGKAAF